MPISAEHITPEWLTAALCAGHSGAAVESFELGSGSEGTTSRRAVTVRYNAAGIEAGLPIHLFTKSSPGLASRLLIGITDATANEALFYTAIRRHLEVGAPLGYFGAVDPRSARSMIVIEDVATTRGATFGTRRVDRPAAESMARELAAYHGGLWEDPRLTHEWTALKDAEAWQRDYNVKIQFGLFTRLGWRTAIHEIPLALRVRRPDLWEAAMRSIAINVRGPQTLLHQDVHPGNWFSLPDGTLCLCDWQGIGRGGWALDYSYAFSAALDIADRRAWEGDLLDIYLDALAASGGPRLAREAAWLSYRQQLFHGFIVWLYTIGVQRIGPELQPDDLCRRIIGRIAQAMVDLEAFASLEQG